MSAIGYNLFDMYGIQPRRGGPVTAQSQASDPMYQYSAPPPQRSGGLGGLGGMPINPMMFMGNGGGLGGIGGSTAGGGSAAGGASGGGSGAMGAMGSLGPIAGIAGAVMGGKALEQNQAGTPVGHALNGLMGPDINQIKEDPMSGAWTAIGLPFINSFTMNDKAQNAKPEWAGLFG